MIGYIIALLQKLQNKLATKDTSVPAVSPVSPGTEPSPSGGQSTTPQNNFLYVIVLCVIAILVYGEGNQLLRMLFSHTVGGTRSFSVGGTMYYGSSTMPWWALALPVVIMCIAGVLILQHLIRMKRNHGLSVLTVYTPLILGSHFLTILYQRNVLYAVPKTWSLFPIVVLVTSSLLVGLLCVYPILTIWKYLKPSIATTRRHAWLSRRSHTYSTGYAMLVALSYSAMILLQTRIWTPSITGSGELGGFIQMIVAVVGFSFLGRYFIQTVKQYLSDAVRGGVQRTSVVLNGLIVIVAIGFLGVRGLGTVKNIYMRLPNIIIAKAQRIVAAGGMNQETFEKAKHVRFLERAYKKQFNRYKNTNDPLFSQLFDATPEEYFGDQLTGITLQYQNSMGTNASMVGKNAAVNLTLMEVNNDIRITGSDVSVLHTDYAIHMTNTTQQNQEVIITFQAPSADSVVADLHLGLYGQMTGVIATRDAAAQVYNDSLRMNRDPAMIEKIGLNTYKLRIFPIPSKLDSATQGKQRVTFSLLTPLQKGEPVTYIPQMAVVNLAIANKETSLISKIYTNSALQSEDRISSDGIEKYLAKDHYLDQKFLEGISDKKVSDYCLSLPTVTYAQPMPFDTYKATQGRNPSFPQPIMQNGTPTNLIVPAVAFWPGKVNQHIDLVKRMWVTDDDGVSGGEIGRSDIGRVAYCRKFYPHTVSTRSIGGVQINDWKAAGNVLSYAAIVAGWECVQDANKPIVLATGVMGSNPPTGTITGDQLPVVDARFTKLQDDFASLVTRVSTPKTKVSIFFDNSLSVKKNKANEYYDDILDAFRDGTSRADVDIYSYNFAAEKRVSLDDIEFWGYSDTNALLDAIENNNLTHQRIIIVTDDSSFTAQAVANRNRNFNKLLDNQLDLVVIGDSVKGFSEDVVQIMSATRGHVYAINPKTEAKETIKHIVNATVPTYTVCNDPLQFATNTDVQKILGGVMSNVVVGMMQNNTDWANMTQVQNAIATKYNIVNQRNSLIALETAQQQQTLDQYQAMEKAGMNIPGNTGRPPQVFFNQQQNQQQVRDTNRGGADLFDVRPTQSAARVGGGFTSFMPTSDASNMNISVMDDTSHGWGSRSSYNKPFEFNFWPTIAFAIIYLYQLYWLISLCWYVIKGKELGKIALQVQVKDTDAPQS